MTADPYQASAGAAVPASWNRYAYVGGDPVNYTDITGMAREGPGPGLPIYFWEWFLRDNPNTLVHQEGESKKKTDEPLQVASFSTTSKEAIGVRNALRWLSAAIEMDADCNKWLAGNQEIAKILLGERGDSSKVYIGVANISETTVNAIAGAGGTNLPADTALLTINLGGAYFKSDHKTDSGRIQGGTDVARAFILLHEMAHLTSAAGFLAPDRAEDRQKTNNDLVHQNCQGVLNRAAGR